MSIKVEKSSFGITPPTITWISSCPLLSSSSLNFGTNVRWPAAKDEAAIISTFNLIASSAASDGVWNKGPTFTSKPISVRALPTTFWPLSWPSWPSLTI